MAEVVQRVRFTVDVIVKGENMSPSAMMNVGANVSTFAHVLAFEDVKNIEVVYTPKEERVVYAHHHDASSGICQVRRGCYEAASDGLSQEDF